MVPTHETAIHKQLDRESVYKALGTARCGSTHLVPSTWRAKPGRLGEVPGQTGLHIETLSQNMHACTMSVRHLFRHLWKFTFQGGQVNGSVWGISVETGVPQWDQDVERGPAKENRLRAGS